MKIHQSKNASCSQRGFTLLELIISFSIGTVVLLAASSLIVSSAQSRKVIKHTAELQEESIFVSHLLKQQLAQAGYRSLQPTTGASTAIPVPAVSTHYPAVTWRWAAGQLINVIGGALLYRFDGASRPDGSPDNSIFDCLGNPIPAGTIIESSISVTNNSLVCTVGTNTRLLVDGSQGVRVEQLQMTLGVDTDGDDEIDQTVSTALATQADFRNTRNLTMRLLLATEDNTVRYNQTYFFNGPTTATDNRVRLESVVSVALRH